MSVTISAKIPKALKQKLEQYAISISRVVRKSLEEEAKRAEEEDLRKRLTAIRRTLKGKVTPEDVVAAVRATRDEA